MRRLLKALKLCLGIAIVALVIDFFLVEAKDSRVSGAISACGGDMGLIPVWPFGTEYRIKFPHPLSSEQLAQLKELNTLRGWVGVAFECELTDDQIRETRKMLPHCHLFRSTEERILQRRVSVKRLLPLHLSSENEASAMPRDQAP